MTIVRYRGLTRRGGGWAGTLRNGESVVEFVEAKFRAGWRRLEVTVGDSIVGAIGDDDEGQRIWWADAEVGS